MNKIAIIQARMGSTRLPGKVLEKIGDLTMLEIIYRRLEKSKTLDKIVISTSTEKEDNVIENICKKNSFSFFRGSSNNVLDRFYQTAQEMNADSILRITADCPLVDFELVDKAYEIFQEKSYDYLSNTIEPTYPDGYDIEIFTFEALKESYLHAKDEFDLEHVTPYILRNKQFTKYSLKNKENFSHIRLTVDQAEDLAVVRKIYEKFNPEIFFSLEEVIKVYSSNYNLFIENQKIQRNEGMNIKKGQKLYKRAKKVIPGGNMLLSKRPEMFLPEQWPAYFQKCKGCNVWDLDGNEFIDMASMGIGTNILGYSHPEVEETVIKAVQDGNMSTLNCPEEVYLAEKMIEIHPWFEMIKFARTGGEANAMSIRIARAATGRDKILVCGYHGWHDWYISLNLYDKDGLNDHLLSGLNPAGVPKGLEGTVMGFEYNNFEQLQELVFDNKDAIAAIKMEVKRNEEPKDNFLEKVRELASANGIVLIFDECTSGFRETNGGLHKKYNITPDLATFGKALGNGHAITCVVGIGDIMQNAQETFISSTFWTEKIGPAAGLKTLEIMEREKSWEKITSIGEKISKRWLDLAKKYELSIDTFGLPSLCGFNFSSKNFLEYKTYITQEMLKKNFLCGNTIYSSISHTPKIIDNYFNELEPLFSKIRDFEDGEDVLDKLEGPICHSGFERLN